MRTFEDPPPGEPGPPLDAATVARCVGVARDIAALKPRFPVLAAFDATSVNVRPSECSIEYAYRTHASTRRGGWAAQVPEPDRDGVWFHVGIGDPHGPARYAQINTQPGFAVFELGDKNVTLLVLEGAQRGGFAVALRSLLRRRGMGQLRR